jgi:hypothetical protein
MDLVSIPYTSWCICSISLATYRLPYVYLGWQTHFYSFSFLYRSIGVTFIAPSPHPFGSTCGGFAFICSLVRRLGCLMSLIVNVSRGSIITTNDVLYLTSHSSVLGIFGVVYYIFFGVWKCPTSFANYNSSSITFFFSFYCMAT